MSDWKDDTTTTREREREREKERGLTGWTLVKRTR